MSRPKFNHNWWTKERVDNGLARYIRDFFEGREEGLPTSLHGYQKLVSASEKGKSMKDRLYPPDDAVLRYYESFVEAWWKFGFLVEVRAKSKKYVMTPEIEARIREIYSHRFGAKERPADLPGIKEYARQLGIPAFVTTRWASELGLARTKEPLWSEAELRLLDEKGYHTPPVLARIFRENGFSRTPTGILLMRKRRLVNKATPYYSVNAVAKLFNVDAHGVKNWIDKGWMKFIFKETARGGENSPQNADTRLVHKDWIYDFVVRHPDAFDIKKVDQLWFLHIVTRGEVKLSFSDEAKMSKRTEGQSIESSVDFHRHEMKDAARETWEKINWLIDEAGMKKAEIARRLGLENNGLLIGKKRVYPATAEKVNRLYEEVSKEIDSELRATDDKSLVGPKALPSNYPLGLRSAAELAAGKPCGVRIKYIAGCRCQLCRRANSDYVRNRDQAQRAGDNDCLVPADYALAHIKNLSAQGVGYKTIAKAGGLPFSTVRKIVNGIRKKIRRSSESKILSVTSEAIAPGANISAEKTWEQINLILDNGFTKTALALKLGNKSPVLQVGRKRVLKSTAEKINAIYKEVVEKQEILYE